VKVLCVIPVRWGSTRFPGKPLAEIGGKPLVCLVAERAVMAQHVSQVIVATDDDRIAARASDMPDGVSIEKTRADHASGTDRVAEVARRHPADVVINIQGDEPMIDPGLIDCLAGAFKEDPTLEMATAKVRITDPETVSDPNCVKVVTDEAGRALSFSRKAPEKPPYYKHLGIYAFRPDFLFKYTQWPMAESERREHLEQLRALDRGVKIRVIETQHDSIGVDTPEDLERVRKLID